MCEVWKLYDALRARGIPSPVVVSYLTGAWMSREAVGNEFVRRVVKVKITVLSLRAFLRSVRYGSIDRLAYFLMVAECDGGGVLLRVSKAMIVQWFAHGILRVISCMKVDSLLFLLAIEHLVEIN